MLDLERRDKVGRVGQTSMEGRVYRGHGSQVRLGPRHVHDRPRHAGDMDAVDQGQPHVIQISGVKATIADEIVPTVTWAREVHLAQIGTRHGQLVEHRRADVAHDVRASAGMGPCLDGVNLLWPPRHVQPIDVHAIGDPNEGTVSNETPQFAL
jgi:hypothetical protein